MRLSVSALFDTFVFIVCVQGNAWFETTKKMVKCYHNFGVIDGSGVLLMTTGDTRPPSLVPRIFAVEHTNNVKDFVEEAIVAENSTDAILEDMADLSMNAVSPLSLSFSCLHCFDVCVLCPISRVDGHVNHW